MISAMEAITQETGTSGRSTRSRRAAWTGAGCAVFLLVLIGVGMFGWHYLTYVPPVPLPNRAMPVPNARDDFLTAITLLPAAGNARIRALYGNSSSNDERFPIPTPELRKLISDSQPSLQRLRVGLGRDFGNVVVLSFNQQFPELGEYRQLARLLAAESELALREGRPDDALRNALDAVKLGDLVQRDGPLIHGLVGVAVVAVGQRSVEHTIDSVDADAAARAARELAQLDARAWTVADALTVERDSAMVGLAGALRKSNSFLSLQNLAGGGGGTPLPANLGMLLQFTFTPRRVMLENYRRYVDAEIARARQPYHAGGMPPAVPNDPLVTLMAPAYTQGRFAWARQQAIRRVLIARLAVRAFTLRNGRPPASLAALVPTYLPSVPADPFAPGPLVYRLVNGEPRVYSRGPDGDDDQGRELGGRINANSNGDLGSTFSRTPTPGKKR